MDSKKEPGKESADDVTRESLIAISYRLPSLDQTAEKSPKNSEKATSPPVTAGKSPENGDEKYRSKLISISSSPSPDSPAQPGSQCL